MNKIKRFWIKARKLGLRLGFKKFIGYEAIFSVAIRERDENNLDSWKDTDKPYIPFFHSDRYWYADPLLYEYGGEEVLFMERVDRETGVGCIVAAEPENLLDNLEGLECAKVVIREDFHMSFPMIFEWNKELYMIPETEMSEGINLYKCEDYPYRWIPIGRFLEGHRLVDSVVLDISSDRVELLASEYKEGDDFYTRFCRYELVKEDDNKPVCGLTMNFLGLESETYNLESRMAGPLFKDQSNELIMPRQRSTSGIYGYSVKFSSKQDLNDFEEVGPRMIKLKYREHDSKKTLGRLIGVHTYSRSSRYEVIDIQYLVRGR